MLQGPHKVIFINSQPQPCEYCGDVPPATGFTGACPRNIVRLQPQTVASGPSKVDCIQKLFERGCCADIIQTLQEDLGFKIPTLNLNYVAAYPSLFEYGEWEYSDSVGVWLKHNLVGSGKHAVISMDYSWVGVLAGFLPGLSTYHDHYDPISLPNTYSDLALVYNNCVVLRAEAKANALDMGEAEKSLTSMFQGNVYDMLPISSTIVGVCSSPTLIKIFKISYNHQLQEYEATPFERGNYSVDQLSERVRFLVDILKILRWIYSVTRPLKSFDLLPNLRTLTKNNHYVTWTGISIIKEFTRNINLECIARVYSAKLPNVEHGEVIDGARHPSIRIDRIGKPLSQAIYDGFDKSIALQHISAGLEQLRQLGLGHGDIKINNIFVDDENVVFLGDLEYCAPLNSNIPTERRPVGATNIKQIEDFDAWRLRQLRYDLEKF